MCDGVFGNVPLFSRDVAFALQHFNKRQKLDLSSMLFAAISFEGEMHIVCLKAPLFGKNVMSV